MPGKDTNIGAKRAREARQELGGDGGCLCTRIEEHLGVPVFFGPMPPDVAGCCWRDGDSTILWVNATQPAPRQRFTLAHELGHLRCGHDADLPYESYETLGGQATDSREVQANAFAAELLAPAEAVRATVAGREPSLEDVVELAACHGTSSIVALYRLSTLGLTRRYDQLKREIDEGLQAAVWERLDPPVPQDVIAEVAATRRSRFSPLATGTGLTAVVEGSASIEDVAARAGCDPEHMAAGLEMLGGRQPL